MSDVGNDKIFCLNNQNFQKTAQSKQSTGENSPNLASLLTDLHNV
jgi:hypothetical protein